VKHRQPKLAVDCIIVINGRILLIYRKNAPVGWALPGGFVEYGETVEQAVRREMQEETGLELEGLKQFRVYSDPGRDPRGHCVSVVFSAQGKGSPQVGDDALRFRLVEPSGVSESAVVFDHFRIIQDFVKDRSSRQV